MEKHWSVSVNVGANNILNIGENYLSGWDDVMDYADTIKGCAEHLLSFIGRESETTTELRAEVLRLTALCDEYRGEVADYKEVIADSKRLVREMDVMLNGEEGAAKQASLCDIVAQLPSALTRARAEGMEKAVGIVAAVAELSAPCWCKEDDLTGEGTVCDCCNMLANIEAALKAAAKGEQ